MRMLKKRNNCRDFVKGIENVTKSMQIISLAKILATKLPNMIAETKFVMNNVQPNKAQVAAQFRLLDSCMSDIFK